MSALGSQNKAGLAEGNINYIVRLCSVRLHFSSFLPRQFDVCKASYRPRAIARGGDPRAVLGPVTTLYHNVASLLRSAQHDHDALYYGPTEDEDYDSMYKKVVWPAPPPPSEWLQYEGDQGHQQKFHVSSSGFGHQNQYVDKPLSWMREAARGDVSTLPNVSADREHEMAIAKCAWDARMAHRATRPLVRSKGIAERARSFERREDRSGEEKSSLPGSRRGSFSRSSSKADQYWKAAVDQDVGNRPGSRAAAAALDTMGRVDTSQWEQRIKVSVQCPRFYLNSLSDARDGR